MSNCSICKSPVPEFDKRQDVHLVIAKSKDGHTHTHGDIEQVDQVRELLHTAADECGIPMGSGGGNLPKAVVFNNKQKIGDSLMFTCAVRDFKKAFPDVKLGIRMTAGHILDNNPYTDPSINPEEWKQLAEKQVAHLPREERDKKAVFDLGEGKFFVKIGPGLLTNKSNSLDWHFANAYRLSIEKQLGLTIPQGESRPDIWLTQEEYDAPRPFAQPYWVICVTGEKGWGCKMYPIDRWQKVVDQNPKLTFVQIGTKGDNPPRLEGKNVIDMVGKTEDKHTGVRSLFKLFLNAEGSIGLVSFHMHLSGGLYKPAVIIAGAREPVSFTRYAGHQYLANDGCLPCAVTACWKCDIKACTNLVDLSGNGLVLQRDSRGKALIKPEEESKVMPKCVDMIEPEEVTKAIQQYYIGGRLKYDVPSEKPKQFKNIVPTPAKKNAPVPSGVDWGKGAIDPLDWPFMEQVIKKHQVKSVLEFGAGLSTVLMNEIANVTSFETEQEWIDKVFNVIKLPLKHSVLMHKWDGRKLPDGVKLENYDMAFVDGPANGQNREEAFRLAVNHCDLVLVHDATRIYEKQWCEKYLKPGFQGPIKGGRWCQLWIKSPSFKQFDAPAPLPTNPNRKLIRIVSTARGWGGCARSITTIMKMLVNAGHDVEFVPFRNEVTSREMIDCLKNGLSAVKVSKSYDVLKEHCDVLLMYADDYVWEFPRHEAEFGSINADRKIMMINYRRGKIGEVPWTKGWDKYLFLNGAQERGLLKHLPGVKTAVYPPCADLEPFFKVGIDYHKPLTIVRHNSQGDTKFDKASTSDEIMVALSQRPETTIHMLPGPSFVKSGDRFKKWPRTGIPQQIAEFLSQGNLFWYSLPKGYMDMGPRVILEAMACGLPILADNWGGAVDRVTPECGWICESKEQMLDVIHHVTPEELMLKGQAARKRALEEFRPERWISELTGEVACAARM